MEIDRKRKPGRSNKYVEQNYNQRIWSIKQDMEWSEEQSLKKEGRADVCRKTLCNMKNESHSRLWKNVMSSNFGPNRQAIEFNMRGKETRKEFNMKCNDVESNAQNKKEIKKFVETVCNMEK